ncbi:MAG: PTS transporter subunit EIIC [Lachnospiraceae bacterium]|nr:PTS transporter subunit EIIC [Lachnospiraceae bacterium]
MGKRRKSAGRFFSDIILQGMGLFLFVGLMTAFFSESGWHPNTVLFEIGQVVYHTAVPLLLGYCGGKKTGGDIGGITGLLAVSGLLVSSQAIGILGAMLVGPAAGYLAGGIWKRLSQRIPTGFEMLAKNLTVAGLGCLFAVFTYKVFGPILLFVNRGMIEVIGLLLKNGGIPLLALLIEPSKVFFLNNGINHGIMIPVGMDQMTTMGKSVFFLLESNPGPGLGILFALYLKKKEKRRSYAAGMIVQSLGGIHEVYFPYVLSNLWLLIPLILGGVCGNLCFLQLNAGTAGPVSPGSILLILLMSGRGELLGNACGIVVSALVAAGTALIVLGMEERKALPTPTLVPASAPPTAPTSAPVLAPTSPSTPEEQTPPIRYICVVCDAGVGSSAMGAALIRRCLTREGIQGIRVEAKAWDQIPEDVDLCVCQHAIADRLREHGRTTGLYPVENFMDSTGYERLIQRLKGG